MVVNITKKDLEKLYNNNEYDKIFEIYSKYASEEDVLNLRNVLEKNVNNLSEEDLKRFICATINDKAREHNRKEQIKNFEPMVKKRTNNNYLIKDENKYVRLFKREIRQIVKDYKKNIGEESYRVLRQIYNTDKENCYLGLFNIRYSVDNYLEEGIGFNKSAELYNKIKIINNFDVMINKITNCNEEKQSYGSLIIKIPKNAVDKKSIPIYYEKDNFIYLNPKYVVAYVPVEDKKILDVEINESMDEVESTIYEGETIEKGISFNKR